MHEATSGQMQVAEQDSGDRHDTEHALLERLRTGDETAFTELVREHHRALVALARTLVGDNDAEEMVQMAWIKAHAALGGFEGRSRLRTWLSSIVLNEARMALRARRRESLTGDADVMGGDDFMDRFFASGHWRQPPSNWGNDSPEALLMNEQLFDCLDRLLASLPGHQRALLELRDVNGQSFESICNILSISASNARVLLYRARRQLYQLVDHYQETGEC